MCADFYKKKTGIKITVYFVVEELRLLISKVFHFVYKIFNLTVVRIAYVNTLFFFFDIIMMTLNIY